MTRRGRLFILLFCLPLLVTGLHALGRFFWITSQRLAYPFELEWMEGAILHQVVRVLEGAPLYSVPTLDFVPALYMPLYYFVAAGVTQFAGVQLFSLRLVSWLSTLLLMCLLGHTAHKFTGSRLALVLAPLCYVATFPYTAFWFDVARIDSLWTLLLFGAFVPLVHFQSSLQSRWLWVSALVWVSAFFTKQASVFLLPFLVLTIWSWGSFRLASMYAVGVSLLTLVLLWLAQHVFGEHFFFFTLQMAASHGVTAYGFERFFLNIFLHASGFIGVALVALVFWPGTNRVRLGGALALAGFVAVSMISRAYAGAFFNVLMPVYAALALWASCACVNLAHRASGSSVLACALLWLLTCALPFNVFCANLRDAARQVPSAESYRVTRDLLEQIAAVPGRVCVFSHGYLGYMVGKGFCAHNTQVTDLVQGSDPERARVFLDDTRARLMRGEYSVLILDREKELLDLGLTWPEAPFDAFPITATKGKMQFVVNGTRPSLWLQYNPATRAAGVTGVVEK
jgi:hypothetical protein